jgi:hypothetical protein
LPEPNEGGAPLLPFQRVEYKVDDLAENFLREPSNRRKRGLAQKKSLLRLSELGTKA